MGQTLSALVAVALLAACAQQGEPTAAPEPRVLTTSTTATTTETTNRSMTTTTTMSPTTTTTAPPAVTDLFSLVPPGAAQSPAGLAEQITAAEGTLRDADATEVDTARAALLQQVAYRKLGAHPEWDADVAAALPENLRDVTRRHTAARREFRGMHTKLSSTLPAWRIVAPDPSADLLRAYRDADAEFGIPWKYLAAINLVETGIGRIRGTSTAGAQGPMQFMPATWEAYGGGGDINNTRDAIRGAARYLAANNGVRDIAHALYRYNHSNRYVRGVQTYADLIAEHPRAFLGFYYWGVWYLTDQGEVHLPVGYEQSAPIPRRELQAPVTAGDDIRNLLGLYCERIDAGDFAGVGELFEHGSLAADSGDELARGAAGVAAFYERGTKLHEGAPRTKHIVTNSVLDIDDERGRATARSSYLVLQQVGSAPLQAIITGRYHDTFERDAGRWRFSQRRFFVDLVGDLSQHLAYTIS